jgi:transposase
MARPARDEVVLNEEERDELEWIARAEKLPWREVQRAKIVPYAAEGQSDVEIAARLDTSSGIVGRRRRRFCAGRLEGLKDRQRAGRPRRFPPEQVAEVKAIARELPATHGLPLSRFSHTELHRLVIERGLTEASASTIWRRLHEDAIRPWQVCSWIFRRDPDFLAKASRVLDLYARRFERRRLRPDEYVISADEKSQLQALGRRHPTTPPGLGRPMRREFDYERGGTLAYLAAWDVQALREGRGEDRHRALRKTGRGDGRSYG